MKKNDQYIPGWKVEIAVILKAHMILIQQHIEGNVILAICIVAHWVLLHAEASLY